MTYFSKTAFIVAGIGIALSGCTYFEPAFPDQVTKSAADGLQSVSSLVASAQLGDFKGPGSYNGAATRYADALAQLEVTRSWVKNRAESNDGRPATKAATLLAADLTECVDGVTEMAQQHRTVGLGQSQAYTLVQVTCAIPINNILQ
ncbi:hypothetical protein [Roseibium sp. RKSG952]|uniref:hypothetical protein n=1 Tax=Roseibium sp. RKSG952 TaxID=2529384 RepID=UPI0012BC64A9|nr:hypothetical protein [Roseibium sp. RKSG952]MTI03237.1 hypothetical protein [Roseibium sp. RKSG952]